MKTASQFNAAQGSTTLDHKFTQTGAVAVQVGMRKPQPQQHGKVDWKTVKTIEDQGAGLGVEIQVLALNRPKYSLVVVQRRNDGNGYSRFIQPRVKTENAVVTVGYHGMVLARLMDEATLYVQDELQKAEDAYILGKQERELRQIERETGKADVERTGKTEREQAKRNRHEQNLAARRAADAERTSKTKGRSSK